MKISAKVNVYEKDSLRGFASINLDDKFIVKDLRIVEGDKGMFVAYPSQKSEKDGKYYERCYPMTKEVRDKIQEIVLEEYNKVKDTKSNEV